MKSCSASDRREKHPLRDKLIVTMVGAILGAGAISIYFETNNFNFGGNVVTITQPSGSSEIVTYTTTLTDTAENKAFF